MTPWEPRAASLAVAAAIQDCIKEGRRYTTVLWTRQGDGTFKIKFLRT